MKKAPKTVRQKECSILGGGAGRQAMPHTTSSGETETLMKSISQDLSLQWLLTAIT